MTKHNLSIIKYNPNAFLDYIKNKNMNELIEKMNDVKITHECMLCKKLKQKLGKNTLGKTLKFCKK
jgi:hypothetical protein